MRKGYIAALVTLTVVLLAACLLPQIVFRIDYGRGPLNREQIDSIDGSFIGKTTDEVLDSLGPPHTRDVYEDGSEKWIYWGDSFGFGCTRLLFGPDGRVKNWWF